MNGAFRLAEGGIACEMDVAPPGDQAEMAAGLGTWMKSLPRDRYPSTVALAGKPATGAAEDRLCAAATAGKAPQTAAIGGSRLPRESRWVTGECRSDRR